VTDDEREEIIRQAKANLDPARLKAEQEELAKRLMCSPLEDPIRKWREEAEATAAKREAWKAEMAAAKDRAPDWSAVDERIQAALVQERAFIMEIVGGAIGQLIEEQHKKDREALTRETDRLWAVLKEVQKAMAEYNRIERVTSGSGGDILRRVN